MTNAINFIQQHGLTQTKECLSICACPEDKWFIHEGDLVSDSDFDDLKRLVESVDLINSQYDGLKNAKELLRISPKLTEELRFLGQAIADYESIYGGEHV